MLLEMIRTFILGIVEGITEWLPISSTGHLILVNELLQNKEAFTNSDLYLYVIQLGATAKSRKQKQKPAQRRKQRR